MKLIVCGFPSPPKWLIVLFSNAQLERECEVPFQFSTPCAISISPFWSQSIQSTNPFSPWTQKKSPIDTSWHTSWLWCWPCNIVLLPLVWCSFAPPNSGFIVPLPPLQNHKYTWLSLLPPSCSNAMVWPLVMCSCWPFTLWFVLQGTTQSMLPCWEVFQFVKNNNCLFLFHFSKHWEFNGRLHQWGHVERYSNLSTATIDFFFFCYSEHWQFGGRLHQWGHAERYFNCQNYNKIVFVQFQPVTRTWRSHMQDRQIPLMFPCWKVFPFSKVTQ